MFYPTHHMPLASVRSVVQAITTTKSQLAASCLHLTRHSCQDLVITRTVVEGTGVSITQVSSTNQNLATDTAREKTEG